MKHFTIEHDRANDRLRIYPLPIPESKEQWDELEDWLVSAINEKSQQSGMESALVDARERGYDDARSTELPSTGNLEADFRRWKELNPSADLRSAWIAGVANERFAAQPVGTPEQARERDGSAYPVCSKHVVQFTKDSNECWICGNNQNAAAAPQGQQTGEGNDGR